jgi:hypothetical protein
MVTAMENLMNARERYYNSFGAFVYCRTEGDAGGDKRINDREDAYPFSEIVGSNGPYAFLGKCHAVLCYGEYRVCVIGCDCLAIIRYDKWRQEKIEVFYFDIGKGEFEHTFSDHVGLKTKVYASSVNGQIEVAVCEEFFKLLFTDDIGVRIWRATVSSGIGSGYEPDDAISH